MKKSFGVYQTISIQGKNGSRVQKALEESPEIITNVMVPIMKKTLIQISAETKVNTPVDQGRLINSWRMRVVPLSGGVRGIFGTDVEYAPAVEVGRSPNSTMPPVPPLERWGWLHFNKKGTGYALALAIAKRGIPGRFMLAKAIKKLKSTIQGNIREARNKAVKEILKRMGGNSG